MHRLDSSRHTSPNPTKSAKLWMSRWFTVWLIRILAAGELALTENARRVSLRRFDANAASDSSPAASLSRRGRLARLVCG